MGHSLRPKHPCDPPLIIAKKDFNATDRTGRRIRKGDIIQLYKEGRLVVGNAQSETELEKAKRELAELQEKIERMERE